MKKYLIRDTITSQIIKKFFIYRNARVKANELNFTYNHNQELPYYERYVIDIKYE
jgi:hypothetical protein